MANRLACDPGLSTRVQPADGPGVGRTMDVRDIRHRLAVTAVAFTCGAIAVGALAPWLAWIAHRCRPGQGGCGTGQSDLFLVAAKIAVFVLFGTVGGVVMEWVHRRREHPPVPRAIVVES